MAEDRIDEIINEIAVKNQLSDLDAKLNALASKLKAFPVLNIGDTKNLRELAAANKEYEASVKGLSKAAADVERSEQQLLKTQALRSKALAEEQKAILATEKAEQQAIKTKEASARASEKAAKAAQDAASVQAANQPIPFTNNLDQLEAERLAIAGNGTALSDFNKDQADAAIGATEYGNSLNKSTKAAKDHGTTVKQTGSEIAKQAALNKINAANDVAALKLQIREEQAAKGSLEQRRAALIRLTQAYDNLGAAERNSAQGRRLGNVVTGLTAQVQALEVASGRAQRNVGNYGAAFTKAFSGLRTLANILPGVGISGIVLFAVEPLIKAVEYLGRASEATKQFALSRKDLSDINKSADKDAAKDVSNLRILYDATQNISLSTKDRTKAAKELQETYPKTFENFTTEDILLGKAKKGYDDLTKSILKSALAAAAKAKLAEIANEELDLEIERQDKLGKATKDLATIQSYYNRSDSASTSKRDSSQIDFYVKQRGSINKETDKLKESLEKRRKTIIDFVGEESLIDSFVDPTGGTKQIADLTKRLNTEFDIYKNHQQRLINAQSEIAGDKRKPLQERLDALEQFGIESQKLINAQENFDIAAKKRESQRTIENLQKDKTGKNVEQVKRINQNIAIEEGNLQQALNLIVDNAQTARLANTAANSKKEVELRRADAEKTIKAEAEILKNGIEIDANNQDAISKSIASGLVDRINAYGKYVSDQQALIENDYALQIKGKVLNNAELLALEVAKDRKLIDLAIKSKKEINDIIVSAGDAVLASANVSDKNKLVNDQIALFAKLKGNKEKFNEESAKLDTDLSLQTLANEKLIIEERAVSGKQTIDQKEKDDKRLIEIDTETKKILLTNEQNLADKKKKLQQDVNKAIQDLATATQDLLFSLADDQLKRQEQDLDEKKRLLDESTERQINQINLLGLNEVDRTKKIAEVQKQAAFQNEQIEKRKREISVQRAKYEKAQAIVSIIQSTAVAVVAALGNKPYTPANIALAAITGAIGALSLAKAIATPLPKYQDGTESAKAGYGIAGEVGHELVTERSGRQYLTPAVPTIMQFKGGEKITPAALTADILNASAMRSLSTIQVREKITANEVNTAILSGIERQLILANRKKMPAWKVQKGIELSAFYHQHFKS